MSPPFPTQRSSDLMPGRCRCRGVIGGFGLDAIRGHPEYGALSGGVAGHDSGCTRDPVARRGAMLDRCSPRRGGDSCLRPVQPNGSPMSPQTDAERELAQPLVESLNLEEVEHGSHDPEAQLFKKGMGLD